MTTVEIRKLHPSDKVWSIMANGVKVDDDPLKEAAIFLGIGYADQNRPSTIASYQVNGKQDAPPAILSACPDCPEPEEPPEDPPTEEPPEEEPPVEEPPEDDPPQDLPAVIVDGQKQRVTDGKWDAWASVTRDGVQADDIAVTFTAHGGKWASGNTIETRPTKTDLGRTGKLALLLDDPDTGAQFTVEAEGASETETIPPRVIQQPPPPPPDPVPLPSGIVTPPDLIHALGELVARSANPPEWPAHYEVNVDKGLAWIADAIRNDRYEFVNGSASSSDPHYGPLRAVYARNARVGLPLDETEPDAAAILEITRECLMLYFTVPNAKWPDARQYRKIQPYRTTNIVDIQLLWWTWKNRAPGTPEREAADVAAKWVHAATQWFVSNAWTSQVGDIRSNYGVGRVVAQCIEACLVTHDMGVPFGPYPWPRIDGVYTGVSWNGVGPTWLDEAVRLAGLAVDAMDAALLMPSPDPRGEPLVYGDVRYVGNRPDGTDKTVNPEPFPAALFMSAMQCHVFRKLARWVGPDYQIRGRSIKDHVGAMVDAIRRFWNVWPDGKQSVPYWTHNVLGSGYKSAVDLGMYPVHDALWLDALDGVRTERTAFALASVEESRKAYWLAGKHIQQETSATDPQNGPALLTGNV
jgi:hypothetical protein